MRKRERFARVVFVCLLALSAASASAQSAELTISPTQFYVFDVENFLTVRGATLGSDSTVVTYTLGEQVFTVQPQVNVDQTALSDVWVPIDVASTVGRWEVRVVATDTTGAQRVYGPAFLDIVERPQEEPPPQLNLPEVVVAEATSTDGANVTFDVGTASCSQGSGSFFPMGSTTVSCSATNSAGTTSASFLVVVTDTTPPELSLPADIVSDDHAVTFTASATDNIDGTLPVTCNPASGSTFPDGDTEVQCTATDAHLNYIAGSFKVHISFLAPPVLTLPANITKEATGPAGAAVTYAATTDSGTISCSPASGSVFPLGTTTVQCSATSAGGTTTGFFDVTVVDTTPPALTLPADITKEATGPNGAAVTYTATATDIVDGSVTVICAPASGSTFALGTTTVQCSATDSHLNKKSGSFQVSVADTTPPVIDAVDGSPREIIWPPNHKMIPIQVIVVAHDAVDPSPHAHIVSVESDQPIDGTGDGDVAPDWNITGALTVELRAERAHGVDRHYTITVEVTDFSGNASRTTLVIAVHP